jgi:hypothetical protein
MLGLPFCGVGWYRVLSVKMGQMQQMRHFWELSLAWRKYANL